MSSSNADLKQWVYHGLSFPCRDEDQTPPQIKGVCCRLRILWFVEL